MTTLKQEVLDLLVEFNSQGVPPKSVAISLAERGHLLIPEEIRAADVFYRDLRINGGASLTVAEKFHVSLMESAQLETMKVEVDKHQTKIKFDAIEAGRKKAQKLSSMNFLESNQETTEKLIAKNVEKFTATKKPMSFIGTMFDGIVPILPGEAILCLGTTGSSKTTTVSNIAYSVIKQKCPTTGRRGKVLIITNEETDEDIYNRIACLQKLEDPAQDSSRWQYLKTRQFDRDQVDYFSDFIRKMKGSGLINVIGLNYEGEPGFTMCLENIRAIFQQLAANPGTYDCVILDYYQLIRHSLLNPNLDEYKVQREFASCINEFKEAIGCSLVIMAQVDQVGPDQKAWNQRIAGTKLIATQATIALEIIPKKHALVTDWIFHKTRYADSGVGRLTTGFKNGLIVAKDASFDSWAESKIATKKAAFAKQSAIDRKVKDVESAMKLEELIGKDSGD